MRIYKIAFLVLSLSLMSFTFFPVKKSVAQFSEEIATLLWKSDNVDVGIIPQGTPKSIQFEFKNVSNKSIIITNVKPACGCTAADYTKEPIAPGKTAFIKATYNANEIGAFTKTVTVTTNADNNPKVLTFKGIVKV